MNKHPSISSKGKDTLLEVYVRPRSPKNKIKIEKENIVIHVKKPANKGKANKAVIKYIADILDSSSSEISFVTGLKSRTKIFQILNKKPEEVLKKFKQAIDD